MRFANIFFGLGGVGLALAMASVTACGGGDDNGGGGGSTSTNSSSSSSSSSGSTSGGACAPSASCKVVDTDCMGLVDNTGLTQFGLRLSELDINTPAKLSTGFVANLIAGDVLPDNKPCNLTGAGTFSWLLQFDTAANTLKTGGGPPVADPSDGYTFSNGTIAGVQVAPATFDVTVGADGSFTITDGKDFQVPVFLSPTDLNSVVILPLKQARISSGKLSASQNCIGKYNADGLDPANQCLAGPGEKTFLSGGKIDAMITLEDADAVTVTQINQSLCAFIAGDGTANPQGVTVCKRDAGDKITFQGDACSQAGQTCTDAVAFKADYAAASVKIK